MNSEERGKPARIDYDAPVGPYGETSGFACLRDQIPDLSDVRSRTMSAVLLNAFFRGRPQASDIGIQAIIAFIRSSDKAVAEFEAARKAAAELHPAGVRSTFFRTLDHFETCITSVARCLRLLPALKANLRRPGIPRELRKDLDAASDKYREARNAIEHIEGAISGTGENAEAALMLYAPESCDRLAVSKYTISFKELATLLRTQRALSEILMDYSELPDEVAANGN
jgi:hypothetical protein